VERCGSDECVNGLLIKIQCTQYRRLESGGMRDGEVCKWTAYQNIVYTVQKAGECRGEEQMSVYCK
jgi:hypothetical protein